MACHPFRVTGKTVGIICTRGSKKPKLRYCVACGQSEYMATMRLCDGHVQPGVSKKRCSVPICTDCAVSVGELDFCHDHKTQAQQVQPALSMRKR